MASTREIVYAALKQHGPLTALQLQSITGLHATSIRQVFKDAQIEFLGTIGKGRNRQKIYRIIETEE